MRELLVLLCVLAGGCVMAAPELLVSCGGCPSRWYWLAWLRALPRLRLRGGP